MNKNKFYEGIFALCNTISPRRKSVVLPLIIIVLGIIVPLVSMQLLSAPDFDDINSAMVLLGIALAVAGAIMLLGRVVGSGEPYDKSSGKYLKTRILCFDRSARKALVEALEQGSVQKLLSVPTCDVSALCVMVAANDNNTFVAAQLFEYAELEYRELSDIKILK